jgi:hypothetical protein
MLSGLAPDVWAEAAEAASIEFFALKAGAMFPWILAVVGRRS